MPTKLLEIFAKSHNLVASWKNTNLYNFTPFSIKPINYSIENFAGFNVDLLAYFYFLYIITYV